MPFRLPLDREPNPEAAKVNPDSAQTQLWLAQAQRDHGSISDKEMAKIEGACARPASRSRVLWNPYTGEFRTKEIAEHYKSGDYLQIGSDGLITRMLGD